MALYIIGIFFALLVCILLFLYLLSEMVFSLITDAPFLNTPENVFDELIKTLDLKDNSVLYDLGCGDASVLRRISIVHPKVKMVGIEISFLPYFLACLKTRNNKSITIRRENIFNSDVKEATHIFTYLFPKGMEKLVPVLEKKCKPETIVVSCDFEDKNRKANEVVSINPFAKRGKRLIVYKL